MEINKLKEQTKQALSKVNYYKKILDNYYKKQDNSEFAKIYKKLQNAKRTYQRLHQQLYRLESNCI